MTLEVAADRAREGGDLCARARRPRRGPHRQGRRVRRRRAAADAAAEADAAEDAAAAARARAVRAGWVVSAVDGVRVSTQAELCAALSLAAARAAARRRAERERGVAVVAVVFDELYAPRAALGSGARARARAARREPRGAVADEARRCRERS